MAYQFLDLGDLSCADIVRQFSHLLIGRIAVNTSFDSGKLSRADWKHVNGFAVTPPITRALVDEWPVSHDDCWDEWWVFDRPVPESFNVTAFCNFCLPIAEYKELNFENMCPLERYLEQYRPVAVLGNNQRSAYLIHPATDRKAS
ncbi:MAG TPA: hypothetical protein VEI08_02025 [Candidatus Bathyarchaeia archaeon]|nr:hypothetical protein [Candidatus Bathyarchaeia archaeon]